MIFKKRILKDKYFDNANDYVFKEGTKKVILTSVHSMMQVKKDRVKNCEPFTKAIAKYVADTTNSYSYIKLHDTKVDSNSDIIDVFKISLLKHIKENDIKFLIDIHGAKKSRKFDIELGTLHNLSIDFTTINELVEAFESEGINNIKINDPFFGGGITKYIYGNTDIDIVQIEINSKFRNYDNPENIEKICNALINFINQYHEIISK